MQNLNEIKSGTLLSKNGRYFRVKSLEEKVVVDLGSSKDSLVESGPEIRGFDFFSCQVINESQNWIMD